MAFDIRSFTIERIVRGVMFDTGTGKAMFSLNQMSDATLSVTSESVSVPDALGSPIVTYDRGKTATLTGTSAMFDFDLLAAQSGVDKTIASSSNTIETPAFEEVTLAAAQTDWVLNNTPVGVTGAEIPFIYALLGDSSFGTAYPISASASATSFALDTASKTITVPTGLPAGTRLWVYYSFNAVNAIEVVNSGNGYGKMGRFVMEVIGNDPCSISTKYKAYVIFGNAKLSSNFDISFTSEGGHPFINIDRYIPKGYSVSL